MQPNPKPLIDRRKKHKGSYRGVILDHKVTGLGPVLKMTQSAYQQILDDLVEHPFRKEKAGILLGPTAEDDLVTHYVPDENGQATYSSFTLDAASLNRTLKHRKGVGLNCKGVVHVHPPGALHPSFGDLEYVAKLFANPKNTEATQVMLPIVADGRLYPYQIDASNPREVLIPRLILI
ncbi:Mov34/MPN/PAD-1 family protein [Gimesia fumaroli]|nr:Mov34/MPN/PAD-1 family protein [Gimesia fumaroli]